MRNVLPILLVALALSACHSRPSCVLSKGRMQRALYDYHLAQTMAETARADEKDTCNTYIASALAKNHITQAQLDSSLRYYNQHPDQLAQIYSHLRDRFSAQSEQLKLQTAANSLNTLITDAGDTTDLWSDKHTLILRTMPGQNLTTFALQTDTTFHPDDKYILTANATFLTSSGTKGSSKGRAANTNQHPRLNVALTLHDSLQHAYSKTKQITQNTDITIQAATAQRHGVSSDGSNGPTTPTVITGYFQMQTNSSDRTLCILDNIHLIRLHAVADGVGEEDTNDDTPSALQEEVLADTTVTTTRRLTPDQLRENTTDEAPTPSKIKTRPDRRTPNSVGPTRKKRKTGN